MRSFEEFKNNFSQPAANVSHVSQTTSIGSHSAQHHPGSPPSRPAPVARPVTPTQHSANQSQPVVPSHMPTPAALVRDENRHGNLDTLIAREEFKSLPSNGKPAVRDSEFIKPYFYLEREGAQTTKQKLDLRASMSFIEYLNCYVKLINDHDAYDQNDKDDMLKHLGAVITDGMVRPWGNVRRWSQGIWDTIERGKCRWNSHYFIQEERVRVSYSTLQHVPAPAAPTNGVVSNQNVQTPALLCRDFNGTHGCAFSGTHESGNVKYVHACAYCDSLGRRSAHSFQRCRARHDSNNHGANQPQHDARGWNNNHRQQSYNGNGNGNASQQYSGNRNGNFHASASSKNA